jgi:hypothetical protein
MRARIAAALFLASIGRALAQAEPPPDGMSIVGLASGCRNSEPDAQFHCRETIYAVMQTHARRCNGGQLVIYAVVEGAPDREDEDVATILRARDRVGYVRDPNIKQDRTRIRPVNVGQCSCLLNT